MCELLTNFGSTRFTGGLNLAANILGKPGKMDVQGDMVQDMYDAGRLAEINDYCRCDVLDTYFVFLRTRVLLGQLTLEAEQQLIAQTKQWLESKADGSPAFRTISTIGAIGRTRGRARRKSACLDQGLNYGGSAGHSTTTLWVVTGVLALNGSGP